MRILLIRHGEPDYQRDSLTPKGWREAELLSHRLMKLPIDRIYLSPMGRAQDTAKPYLEKTGKTGVTLPWLREFMADAYWPGPEDKHAVWNLPPRMWTKMPELFDKDQWVRGPFMSSGNVPEVKEWVADGLTKLLGELGYIRDGYIWRCENNTDETVAIFCHFGLGMAILGELLGVSYSLMWQAFFMPTTSVTTLITEEREKGECYFKCMSVGDTSHLYAGEEELSKSGLFRECYKLGWENRPYVRNDEE